MGKLNNHISIHHFSHPHPLELTDHKTQTQNIVCSGCKHRASGSVYVCKSCNYVLHISCSKMPKHITHPIDPSHALVLLPYPTYPEGFFNCDACGRQGNGFSYQCRACNIDIHITCASMPLSINHLSHHHALNLTFSPPYLNKSFSCDICNNFGSNHWLYRCNQCEFDAHLTCATAKPKPPANVQRLYTPSPIASSCSQPNFLPSLPPPGTIPQYQTPGAQYATGPFPRATQPSWPTGPANGFLNNPASQQLGLNFLQAIIGGGGGGGAGGGNGCDGGGGNVYDGGDGGGFSFGDILGGLDGGLLN